MKKRKKIREALGVMREVCIYRLIYFPQYMSLRHYFVYAYCFFLFSVVFYHSSQHLFFALFSFSSILPLFPPLCNKNPPPHGGPLSSFCRVGINADPACMCNYL